MALINRFSRLFKADLHAVLDRIEEPDVLLKQAIREMEEEIASSERLIKSLQKEQAILVQYKLDYEQSIIDFDKELDVCLESGKEDLARALIKRKLEAERILKQLVRKGSALENRIAEQQSLLEENCKRCESIRQKAELLEVDICNDDLEEDNTFLNHTPDSMIQDDEIEVALLREKKLRKQRCGSEVEKGHE